MCCFTASWPVDIGAADTEWAIQHLTAITLLRANRYPPHRERESEAGGKVDGAVVDGKRVDEETTTTALISS